MSCGTRRAVAGYERRRVASLTTARRLRPRSFRDLRLFQSLPAIDFDAVREWMFQRAANPVERQSMTLTTAAASSGLRIHEVAVQPATRGQRRRLPCGTCAR